MQKQLDSAILHYLHCCRLEPSLILEIPIIWPAVLSGLATHLSQHCLHQLKLLFLQKENVPDLALFTCTDYTVITL